MNELRALLRLAGPLALVSAGNQLMALVDTAIVGRLGAAALGGVGVANSVFLVFTIVGMGVMMGLDPLIAQALGAGDRLRARRLLWQGVWMALLATAALSIPIAASIPLLEVAGVPADATAQARPYLAVRLLGITPFLLFIALRGYLQALGNTRVMVVAMLVGNVFNVGATLLLVFGGAGLPAWTGPLRAVPSLGVAGAAIATVACQGLQALILAFAVRALVEPGHTRAGRRPSRAELLVAARIGWPIGLQMGAEVGIFAIVTFLAGRLGTLALAAHQVALTLASMSFTFALGVAAAGSVRVGLAIGARDAPGTRRAGLVAFAGGAGVMACFAAAFAAFPHAFARLLTDSPEVLATAAPLMFVAAVFQLSDGVQAVGAGVLRGAGDTRFSFAANIVGHYGLGLPVALALGLWGGLGVNGLWWGLCAGLTSVAVALLGRFLRISSRPIAPIGPPAR